jgi:metal-sulfur cluster biosynthetic enzyme
MCAIAGKKQPVMTNTTALTADDIWQALAAIPDPEFGVNIVDLGLIYSVEAKDGDVHVVMTLTTETCPSGGWMHSGAEAAIQALAGVRSVRVDLVFEPPWTPEMLSAAAKQQLGWTRDPS